MLFSLQGIPCLYYGTEQGLQGTVRADGAPDLGSLESVRQALWGKPAAFDKGHPLHGHIGRLASLRRREPPLSFGRLYFREVSGNGIDFGQSSGPGGVVAFSRILADREVVATANTSSTEPFSGFVLVDRDLSADPRRMSVEFSNIGTRGAGEVRLVENAPFHRPGGEVAVGTAAVLPIVLAPHEAQILVLAPV